MGCCSNKTSVKEANQKTVKEVKDVAKEETVPKLSLMPINEEVKKLSPFKAAIKLKDVKDKKAVKENNDVKDKPTKETRSKSKGPNKDKRKPSPFVEPFKKRSSFDSGHSRSVQAMKFEPHLQSKSNPDFHFKLFNKPILVGIGIKRMRGYISNISKEILLKRRAEFWGKCIKSDANGR